MTPKIHPKGHSFKGCATYLLHDKEAKTANRLEWTLTLNLATDNPHVAWRVMSATAMNSAALKRKAGIKNTGRKSGGDVLHVTLSWHKNQHGEIDRNEMLTCAHATLDYLGAQKHQAMVVCHNDSKHPHIHLLINRVGEDGRRLSSSFERMKASRWAQKYEEASGKIYCHQRVLNNAARDRGEYVRAKKDIPRHIYEQQQSRSNDNTPKYHQLISSQKAEDQKAGKQYRKMVNLHQEQWSKLSRHHQGRIGKIKSETKRAVGKEVDRVRGGFRPQWEALYHDQQKAIKDHQRREGSKIGRMGNAIKSIRFKDLFKSDQRKQVLTEAFGVISNGDQRLNALKAKLDKQSKALANEQSKAEKQASLPYRQKQQQQIKQAKQQYITDRAELIQSQQTDQSKQKSLWKTRRQDRIRSFELANVKRPVRDAFKEVANDLTQSKADTTKYNQDQTIDAHKKRLYRKAKQESKRKRDRGHER